MGWLFKSRKAQVAIGSIFTVILARLLTRLGFTDQDINIINGATVVLASVWIHGIAKEDAAKSLAGQEPSGDPPTIAAPVGAPAQPVATATAAAAAGPSPQPTDAGLTPAQQQHVATIARQQILFVIQNAQKQKQQAQAVAETLTPAQAVPAQPQQPTP